jgi:amino acid adenylation domain-containing protein
MRHSIADFDGTLAAGFLRSARRFPDRPALEIGDTPISYRQLEARATTWAASLDDCGFGPEPRLTAILGQRSEVAFTGVLAALLRGHAYVPLHPGFPAARIRDALIRSGAVSLIVDAQGETILNEVLADFPRPMLLLLPHLKDAVHLQRLFPQHRIVAAGDIVADAGAAASAKPEPGAPAYLLFTSGSTGRSKGVLVAHHSVRHFIECMRQRYPFLNETDRFSQTFDLTFDLSLFDMFVAWECGACVCCPTEEERMLPTSYLDRARLTVWFSVPSLGALMEKLGLLSPGRFPGLRLSLFCGEGLPVSVATAWQRAAPQAPLENLYGPTELTIACTAYTWRAQESLAESRQGLVPIGAPLSGLHALVVDENLEEVPPGESGELLIAGPQRALGYLDDPEQTARAFLRPPGHDEIYYRTGDRVERPSDDGPLTFLGRSDGQVKIRGFRVELGEIEAAIREEAATNQVAVVAWPPTAAGADGIIGFVQDGSADVPLLLERLTRRLPGYMQPHAIHQLRTLPLNANGKIDRNALRALLADGLPA